MVDQHIGRKAIETGNTYLYKNIVQIPPLAMHDDTLGISECGMRTKAMNEFLNMRTNLMNLQFGIDKCVKMDVWKTHNQNICLDLEVDAWKEELVEKSDGQKVLEDRFVGREKMKDVKEKKYLRDIISSDGQNCKNIKERIN